MDFVINLPIVVDDAIRQGDVNRLDEFGLHNTLLHIACYVDSDDSDDAVRDLLQAGANVEYKNKDGMTPLHIACEKNHTSITRMLIKAGANVNAKDNGGKTPLHLACEKNHKYIAEILITAHANVNAQDDDGRTPLFGACYRFNIDIIRMLLEANVNLKIRDMFGRTVIDDIRHKKERPHILEYMKRSQEEFQLILDILQSKSEIEDSVNAHMVNAYHSKEMKDKNDPTIGTPIQQTLTNLDLISKINKYLSKDDGTYYNLLGPRLYTSNVKSARKKLTARKKVTKPTPKKSTTTKKGGKRKNRNTKK